MSPWSIIRAASGERRAQLYLGEFDPEIRSAAQVTRQFDEVRAFVTSKGKCVLKPLVGTRGQGGFTVDGPDASNLRQIFEVIARSGPVMVQRFVPEAMDGAISESCCSTAGPLVVDGCVCAVRRVPGTGDFRGNIHVGVQAVAADVIEQ